MPSLLHTRNTASRYEIQLGDGPYLFVSDAERAAIQKAINHAHRAFDDHVRIYCTDSSGRNRRYFGWIGRDGVLHRCTQ